MRSVIDILQEKLIKRGVPVKAARLRKVEPAAGGTVRQVIRLRVGIDADNARLLVRMIKDTKLKVQAQIMEDQVRVSGRNKGRPAGSDRQGARCRSELCCPVQELPLDGSRAVILSPVRGPPRRRASRAPEGVHASRTLLRWC